MSRTSRKSELSPSITKSGSGIDLGKRDVEVDMGRKSTPSITSGGIGVTREVTNIGGVSVTAGANVDLSPIDLGINYDTNENAISVAAGAELPGGLLGASGGVTIDLDTGQVTGASVGVEGLGVGVNISGSKDGGAGVSVSLQIPFTPIEIELGLGFPSKKPNPSPTPTPTPGSGGINWERPVLPPARSGVRCTVFYLPQINWQSINAVNPNKSFLYRVISSGSYNPVTRSYKTTITVFNQSGTEPPVIITNSVQGIASQWSGGTLLDFYQGGGIEGYSGSEIEIYKNLELFYHTYTRSNSEAVETYTRTYNIIYSTCGTGETPTPTPSPSPSPPTAPFPNPPPTRRNMDECCRDSIKLQRLIVRHLGAERSSGQETLPSGVREIGSTQEGIRQAYPFTVKKRWVDPNAKEDEGISILNDRQLALVLGGMIERLERVLGTAEFYKDSDKKLRQSEGNMLSWLTGKNKDFNYPDPNDFWLNTDDGVINEKLLEVRSIADGLRYQIEALNRLERILPIAELKDSSIPARWIYPNGEGQLRVGNLIHLCEYMIRKDDRDRGYWPQKITIKKPNPVVEGDEGIHYEFHSQADLLRFLTQQIIDTEGDVDVGSNYDLRRTYLDIMAFQLTVKNNRYLQAITEFMNFEISESVDKVPIPFDFFAGQNRTEIQKFWNKYGLGDGDEVQFPTSNKEEEIEKLSEGVLQNSEIEIAVVEFGSKGSEETTAAKKEPKTLNEMLLEILKHSSASAAAVTEKVSEGALERAVEAASLARKLEAFLLKRNIKESIGIGDLDNWIASAEKGYTDNPESESLRFPESDPLQPYGRAATQNPTIREIDTKDPKAD